MPGKRLVATNPFELTRLVKLKSFTERLHGSSNTAIRQPNDHNKVVAKGDNCRYQGSKTLTHPMFSSLPSSIGETLTTKILIQSPQTF